MALTPCIAGVSPQAEAQVERVLLSTSLQVWRTLAMHEIMSVKLFSTFENPAHNLRYGC